MQILDYQIRETLHQGKKFFIYRAGKAGDQTSYILKALEKKSAPSLKVLRAMKNEYRFLSRIDSELVVKTFDLIDGKDYAILVLEDIQGHSLKDESEQAPLSLQQFLSLALQITRGLSAIHQQNIIHKDINPSNIIRNAQNGRLQIVDFDISSNYNSKVSLLGNPEHLAGTLPYISPEQTGRMNRSVDQRSDLYSLGVTFYELLTGRRPFESDDPLELVHAHLAKMPAPPIGIIDNCELTINNCQLTIVSNIIMKLLAKNAENRYQSAEGLLYDLEEVQKINLAGLQTPSASSGQALSGFTLATKDFSGTLQIPEKLYGREREIRQLSEAYQRVSQGNKELLLVAGYSGTGKTALVNELHKALSRDRGYFVSGKFDQLQRSIPYSALIQAFNQFCDLLLTERQERLEGWKTRISEALEGMGRVLTDLIPSLETLIGLQPDLPEVAGQEAEQRFHYVFQRFLQVIADQDHPLLIFLDDLQWADLPSLKLLELFMKDVQIRHVLFIGAYRDNEVSTTHPLMMTLEGLQQHETALETIPVRNLSVAHLQQWIAETLHMTDSSSSTAVKALADLIFQKTQGNAFFTIQFLHKLYEEELLRFDVAHATWTWDLAQIETQDFSDNVVDLLTQKIQRLPQQSRELLTLAACIGNRFALSTLAVIAENAHEDPATLLDTVLSEQLVAPVDDDTYRFIHDRIHQAAYSLITDDEKAPVHLKIGRLLLQNSQLLNASIPTQDESLHLFDIVNHLNLGIELIDDDAEKLQLAGLNLRAGQQARASAAYASGAAYLQTARRLVPDTAWDEHYDLALALAHETIQSCYLRGEFEAMETSIETVLAAARDISHRTVAYEYRILGFTARNQPQVAAETVLAISKSLGVDFPESFGELKEQNIESLLELPLMDDPEKQLAIRLFYTGAAALMFGRPDLLPLVTNRMLALTLESGLTPEAPFVLSMYGILRLLVGDLVGAYRSGKIAMTLLERGVGSEAVKVRAFSIVSFYLLGNKQHYKEVSRLMFESYPLALNVGDFEYASYILSTYLHFLSRTDTELSVWKDKAESLREQIIQINQPIPIIGITIESACNAALQGEKSHPASVLDLDLDNLLQNIPESLQAIYRFSAALKQIVLGCVFGDNTTLLDDIRIVENNWAAVGIPIPYYSSDFHFYRPLGYIQLHGSATTEEEREEYLNKVGESLTFLKNWSEFGPMNVLHKYELLQAELARIHGETWKAAEFYDMAIEYAHQHEYVHEAALANELAARFYLERKREQLAACYLQQARLCYRRWGATAKVTQMEALYPRYLRQTLASGATSTGTTSSGTTAAPLDIHTILKATRTLSGTVQLKSLLENMMRIALENAGAQRGLFVEVRDGRLLIQAAGETNEISDILAAIPAEDSGRVPMTLLNYVARSKTQQVFDNLSKEAGYRNDPYVQQQQPQSALCFPVLKQGELTAILYLENNAVEGAFTPARLEVLNMLSAQIAISVENAELYENLEERVKQRTAELRKAHNELAEVHEALTDNVNYSARIQQAVLPADETLATLFPEHFILLLPHSVVSGDFYWMRELEGKIIVAAVDCTGHGVSGALVSMLGTAFLNEIVPLLATQGRLEADLILNALREKVKSALRQRGEFGEQKEGMDMALCLLDPAAQQLQFAGAYNPLYLIRAGELNEIKADRMPIGVHRRERPFSRHDMAYQPGDMLYLFSDGFLDQHSEQAKGGFGRKRFQHLLLDIHQQDAVQQREALLQAFDSWKGARSQTDDVLVMGVRL